MERLVRQSSDLLPRYASPGGAGGLPQVPPARAALDRFEKLCRDAQRRAAGLRQGQ
jgi:hypothetical protein